jgi:tRNA threonylcarbamoyladenosine modification (KEOPS) complex Cgi121 subunit
MLIRHLANYLVGLVVFVQHPETRAERGLSQSAENAILLAGAVSIAIAVIVAIKAFVLSHMPK